MTSQPDQDHHVPTTHAILRAGASGAAIAGTWTGVHEAVRVRNREASVDEAVRATAGSAAVGAAAGAEAQVATHVARRVPLAGLAVVAIGLGALYLSQSGKRPADDAEKGSDTPAAES